MAKQNQKEQKFLLDCLDCCQNFENIGTLIKSIEYLSQEECYWYLKKWAELDIYVGGTSLNNGIFISKQNIESYVNDKFSNEDVIDELNKLKWHQFKESEDCWL